MAQIFVIDPRPNVINLSRSVLTGRGHAVTTFQNFEESLQIISTERPELVVVSPEGPPKLAPKDLVARIQNACRDSLIIILLSNTEDDKTISVSLESGAADVVLTPFVPAELAGRIAGALNRRARRKNALRQSSGAKLRAVPQRTRGPRSSASGPRASASGPRSSASGPRASASGPRASATNPRTSNRIQAQRPARSHSTRKFDHPRPPAEAPKAPERVNEPIPDVLPNGELSGVGVLKLALAKDNKKIKGRIFDCYRLVKILGVGGMGVVIQAIHRETGQPLALKVLRSDIEEDPEAPLRFLREAYVLQAIHDPNVVRLEDIGRAGGTRFYAMEFVEGITLADLLDERGRLSISLACHLASGLANALAALAKQGVVHRDIKPGNIFISKDFKEVKLGDFGLAKRSRARDVTPRKSLIGTPHYLAPEVIAGEPATPSSDIYSLGVVLHEMLSGRTIHDEEPTAALLFKIVYGDPPSIEATLNDLPEPIRSLVDSATRRYPENRYPDATALAVELSQLSRRYSRRVKPQGTKPHG
ncbi:MAG: protein kinase [Planctomycetota bacterium]|nr:protein kinase [Planctomycetota bacterium]